MSVIESLRGILVPDRVLTDEKSLDRSSGEALGDLRAFRAVSKLEARPMAVVQPTTTSEVSALLTFANTHRIPVVPYGAGTGVMGGAVAVDGCIVMDLKGVNHIHEISPANRYARVGPGVVLGDLEESLKREGLMLGHDPWSLPIATVGGAISTNGVGYRAGKYGSMGDQVLGMEVALASGEVISTRRVPKDTAGPSLNHLFIGSEGTLGIITEATIRVFPRPESRILRVIQFPSFECGFEAIMKMYSLDLRPALLDFAEEPPMDGSEGKGETVLYMGSEGFREEVEAQDSRGLEICNSFGGREMASSEATSFWEQRHSTAYQYKRRVLDSPNPGATRRANSSCNMDYLHVALPASLVLEYRQRCREILSRRNIAVREWSIWGLPEFLSFLIVGRNDGTSDSSEVMAATVDEVLTLAHRMNGAMEYCHGVGLKLGHLMEGEMGSAMGTIRALKRALDPKGILNPGKLGL